MKLLYPDPNAKDPLYNKIQENFPHFDPPTLLRDRVEELYEACHDLVDKKFPSQIKHKFASCFSELYFCTTFKRRLGLIVTHPSDKGPDYYLESLDCWAEVVTLSNGEKNNPNSIPKVEYGVVSDQPKDQIILRITNSFTEKAKKIFTYMENGLIRKNQRIIICISGGWIEAIYRFPSYASGGFPEVVSALLHVGDMAFIMNKKDMNIVGKKFEFKDHVNKKDKNKVYKPIKTDFFTDTKYACISAVIYSYANVTDSIETANLGRDFFIIHNPLAINRLPIGSFNCGTEYNVAFDSNSINITPFNY